MTKAPRENPEIPCGCGCGGSLLKYDSQRRERRYIFGHAREREARQNRKAVLDALLKGDRTIGAVLERTKLSESQARRAFASLCEADEAHCPRIREWHPGKAP